MRLVLTSDTHNLHDRMPPIPDGDVLVHAGDLTKRGTLTQLTLTLDWLAALPHRRKLIIAGNHDFCFEQQPEASEALVRERASGVTYLRDAGTTIDGVRFWGSPWQPEFFDWAFNLPRGDALARVWAQIPDDTHVLVTHGPPMGILDRVIRPPYPNVGCEALRARIAELPALRLHVFGHIHEGAGLHEEGGVTFVNASATTVNYEPVHAATIVDL